MTEEILGIVGDKIVSSRILLVTKINNMPSSRLLGYSRDRPKSITKHLQRSTCTGLHVKGKFCSRKSISNTILKIYEASYKHSYGMYVCVCVSTEHKLSSPKKMPFRAEFHGNAFSPF